MNERILEIAKLATQQYSMTYYPKEFMENFAKLIVLECAEWMQSAEDTDGSYIGDSFYWANELKKHFGVQQ